MKTLKKVLKWLGITILVFVVVALTLYVIYLRPVMQKMEATNVIKYDKDLTIVIGGGGNSGILVSDSLVIVIDTKMGDAAEDLYKTVKELAGNKPILVINTHDHSDHTGGNKFFKGQRILAGGEYTKEAWIKDAGEESLPTEWLQGPMDIKMGDDTATIFTLKRDIHTESDIFVYLHKRKMLFGGDVILNKQIPALVSKHADPDGYMFAFDRVPNVFDVKVVVPGHGPMGDISIIKNFQEYFTDMETVADDAAKKDELVAKYADWTQIPFIMSPGATISAIKKKEDIK